MAGRGERLGGVASLRRLTARGTIVNGAFLTGVNLLALLRGLVVAAYLSASEFGVWGIVMVSMTALMWFRRAGIGEKYVEQDEPDQERAYRKALTLELVLAGAFTVAGGVLLPLISIAYDTPEAALPGLLMLLTLPAVALQAPLYVFYRRMDFARQRRLQAADPLVAFAVTVALAVAGAGYWSLVIGAVCGAWAGAVVALRASPYRLRLCWDRATVRSYARFSAPLLAAGGTGVLFGQVLLGVGEAEAGLAGVGAITLAGLISQFAKRADDIVTNTLYPALCTVKDRPDLLFESFLKSNRLAVIWGLPFGVGLVLFAGDLVSFVIGEQWRPATLLIQLTGAAAALHQIGFNWDAFYRARGQTAPIGWAALWSVVAFGVLVVPGLVAWGLDGLAWSWLGLAVANLAVRGHYLRRLFPRLRFTRYVARALIPCLPPVALVLAVRLTISGERTFSMALAELAVYAAATIAVTLLLERPLLRELTTYLRPAAQRA